MFDLIPMPKTLTQQNGVCDFTKVYIDTLCGVLSDFLKAQLEALVQGASEQSIPLTVSCGEDDTAEGYRLMVTERAVTVEANGCKGVFYAIQTLRQLLQNGKQLPCLVIEDEPDLRYRGFYQDVSRGRIPTLDTLKRLVDRLSAVKMNSLQLYVEHTHRFAEYAGIQEELGFYTDDEIRELDCYCKERCVELIPSLSSFGHLYFLLQSPKYRHLCELEAYEPTRHCWHERLLHHTIDPLNPDSVKLITDIMAQYLPLFSSSYFNICCDETFDLCKGRNAGGDVAAMYVGFVRKLVSFLQERGKTVMMWGDIVMQHPEALEQLPGDIVFLNWCYDMNGSGLNAEVLSSKNRMQIVCPSVHSHKRFVEKIVYSAPNIAKVIEQGFAHGAMGMLSTNWGDYGHVCNDEGVLYGLSFGAAKAWNIHGTNEESFDKAVTHLVYGSDSTEVINILKELGACDEIPFPREGYEMALWELTVQLFDNEYGKPQDYEYRLSVLRGTDLRGKRESALSCAKRLQALAAAQNLDPDIARSLIIAARGMAMVFAVLDAVFREGGDGISFELTEEINAWLADFGTLWYEHNQPGEWARIETFFKDNINRIVE